MRHALNPSENASPTAVRDYRTPVVHQLLPSIPRAGAYVACGSCSFVTVLSLYPAPGCVAIPRAEGQAPYCSSLAYTSSCSA